MQDLITRLKESLYNLTKINIDNLNNYKNFFQIVIIILWLICIISLFFTTDKAYGILAIPIEIIGLLFIGIIPIYLTIIIIKYVLNKFLK